MNALSIKDQFLLKLYVYFLQSGETNNIKDENDDLMLIVASRSVLEDVELLQNLHAVKNQIEIIENQESFENYIERELQNIQFEKMELANFLKELLVTEYWDTSNDYGKIIFLYQKTFGITDMELQSISLEAFSELNHRQNVYKQTGVFEENEGCFGIILIFLTTLGNTFRIISES